MLVRNTTIESLLRILLPPRPFTVLVPTLIILVCNSLAILDLFLCSQPPRCSHFHVILNLYLTLFTLIIFLLVGCLIPILL